MPVLTYRCILLCAVYFCGHLRSLAYYALSTLVDTCAHLLIMLCPLLWTLTLTCLLCFVHFSGHLRVMFRLCLFYLMASKCPCRELSVANIYRITYSYQLYQNGIISTFLSWFSGQNSGIMELYN